MKTVYKTLTYYDDNKFNKMIFNYLMKISKNVYNTAIYSNEIYSIFKYELYEKLYNKLLKNKNIDCNDYVNKELLKYFDIFSQIKNDIKSNNSIIYGLITQYIKNNNIIIHNDNINELKNMFYKNLITNENIKVITQYKKYLFTDIIDTIINFIYKKNIKYVKELVYKKQPIPSDYLIVFNRTDTLDFIKTNIFKVKIEKEMNKTLRSDETFITNLTRAKLKLSDNNNKLDSTMIGTIITKAFNAYESYYALYNKGYKPNKPKYLKDKFNLIYTYSKISKNNNILILNISKYLNKNFNSVFTEYVKLDTNKFINKQYLKNKINNKITKKNNYIIGNKYIEKNNKNILSCQLKIPKIICDRNIKTIEILNENNRIKICVTYEDEINDIIQNELNINNTISIDMGVKNLMTIYNPKGEQYIISGAFLCSTNEHYNELISKAQSKNQINKFNKLQIKRKCVIENYFNLIIKWFKQKFNGKNIIIGYNKEWKQNTYLGKLNNMKFNKIPFMKLIGKLQRNFNVILTEESYTSKCDALSLEKICKHDIYSGKRTKRGLFCSSVGRMINADLNGAINIMRKKIEMTEIIGALFNPIKVKIFREVFFTQRIKGL